MSRSRKKNLISKSGRWAKSIYWKIVRNVTRQIIRNNKSTNFEDLEIPNAKSIVNDYDHCDYIYICDMSTDCRCMIEYGRRRCFDK